MEKAKAEFLKEGANLLKSLTGLAEKAKEVLLLSLEDSKEDLQDRIDRKRRQRTERQNESK